MPWLPTASSKKRWNSPNRRSCKWEVDCNPKVSDDGSPSIEKNDLTSNNLLLPTRSLAPTRPKLLASQHRQLPIQLTQPPAPSVQHQQLLPPPSLPNTLHGLQNRDPKLPDIKNGRIRQEAVVSCPFLHFIFVACPGLLDAKRFLRQNSPPQSSENNSRCHQPTLITHTKL